MAIPKHHLVADMPTNSFATLNPLTARACTVSEGNLKFQTITHDNHDVMSSIAIPTKGIWYFEMLRETGDLYFAVAPIEWFQANTDSSILGYIRSALYYGKEKDNSHWTESFIQGHGAGDGSTYYFAQSGYDGSVNDVHTCCLDFENRLMTVTRANIGLMQAPLNDNIMSYDFIYVGRSVTGGGWPETIGYFNFGQNPTFSGQKSTLVYSSNFTEQTTGGPADGVNWFVPQLGEGINDSPKSMKTGDKHIESQTSDAGDSYLGVWSSGKTLMGWIKTGNDSNGADWGPGVVLFGNYRNNVLGGLGISGGEGGFKQNGTNYGKVGTNLDDGEWHHLALVYDGHSTNHNQSGGISNSSWTSGNFRVYVDGEAGSDFILSGSNYEWVHALMLDCVGYSHPYPDVNSPDGVAAVHVFNRPLSASQIAEYAADATKPAPSALYTDASGYGEFYYEPPAGAMAICTANITPANVVSAPYVVDETGKHSISVVGTRNVEISNKSPYLADVDMTLSPSARHAEMKSRASQNFKGGSYVFDETSGINVKSKEITQFGIGDFAIEFWVYMNDIMGKNYWCLTDLRSGPNETDAFGFFVQGSGATPNGALYVYCGATKLFNQVLQNKTWHHVALVRQNGNLNCFLDGIPGTSVALSNDISTTNDLRLGVSAWTTNFKLDGKIADLRITKGDAVYTGAFTPPTEPLQLEEGKDQILLQPWKQAVTLGGYKQADESQENARDHFKAVTWVGNSSNNREINLNFAPDLVWIKNRDDGVGHILVDSVRGSGKLLHPNGTSGQDDFTTAWKSSFGDVTGFTQNGFKVNTGGNTNGDGNKMVAWCWKAGGSDANYMKDGVEDASISSGGSITPSKMSVNTKAGFSIISYTSNPNSSTGITDTLPHGLTSVPEMIIIKQLNNTSDWMVWQKNIGNDNLNLNNDSTTFSVAAGGIRTPDQNFIDLGGSLAVNSSWSSTAQTYICYAWHSVPGYSSFGSYTGTGTRTNGAGPTDFDGPFINCGFAPAFVMIKSSNARGWYMYDNQRDTHWPLRADTHIQESQVNGGELGWREIDFHLNGFKIRNNGNQTNQNDTEILYMAFADSSVFGELGNKAKANPIVLNSQKGFKAVKYDGASTPFVDVGFKPDLTWVKSTDQSWGHGLFSSLNTKGANGGHKYVWTDKKDAESDLWGAVKFDDSGWTGVGSSYGSDPSFGHDFGMPGKQFISWNWKAGGAPEAGFQSNDAMVDGEATTCSALAAKVGASITPFAMSVNTETGFSIVRYTGDGEKTATVPHGLSGNLDFIMTKDLNSDADFWHADHISLPSNANLFPNNNWAKYENSADGWLMGTKQDNVIAFGSGEGNTGTNVNAVNEDGIEVICYCWKAVPGYSAFGSYTGNGSPDGPFVYTGFKPAFVMVKQSSASGESWTIHDNARGTFNKNAYALYANRDSVESSGTNVGMNFFSNGFKQTEDATNYNEDNTTYIYIAFAEQPFELANAR